MFEQKYFYDLKITNRFENNSIKSVIKIYEFFK